MLVVVLLIKIMNFIKEVLELGTLMFVLLLLHSYVTYEPNEVDEEYNICDRYVMYNKSSIDEGKRVNGVYYFKDDFYCVWIKERTEMNINRTVLHEECHSLINKDTNNHFCTT